MKKTIILIIGIFFIKLLTGQVISETTLAECRKKSVENYPLKDNLNYLESSNTLKIKSLNKNYFPGINLSGHATYQSEVTEIPIDVPYIEIPQVPKDQYKIAVDVSQVIYDGGLTEKQKTLEKMSLDIENNKINIELYNLKERVNQIYFNIILLKKNIEILELVKENLKSRFDNLKAGVDHGVALKKDLNVLKAEIMKTDQKLEEIKISLVSLISTMAELTNEKYNENTKFLIPEPTMSYDLVTDKRLEYQLFSLQQSKLIYSKKMITARYLPKFYGFGQAGYGRPGLNMLSDDFSPFYIVGAKLNWKLWNWNQRKQDKQVIDIQRNILEKQKETFEKNLRIDLMNKMASVEKYEKLIEKDNDIIDLRSKIVEFASSQLDNGIITSTEYLTELNAETKAKLNLELHKVKLIKAKIDFISAKGNL